MAKTKVTTETAPKVIVRNITIDIYSDRRIDDKAGNAPIIEDPIYRINFNPEQGPLEINFSDNQLWIGNKPNGQGGFVLNLHHTSHV